MPLLRLCPLGFGVFRGTWGRIKSGAGSDSHPSFSSRCEEVGGSHQQFTGTRRFLHFRDGQGNSIPTLPSLQPHPWAHSLSSSLDFVVTPQSHPGLSLGDLKRWEETSGKSFCFPVLWALV